MSGKPRNKPRVVESNVPIIGQLNDKDRKVIDTAVNGMIQKVEPMLNGLGGMVEELGRRVAVVEEMVSATLVDTIATRVGEVLEAKSRIIKRKEKE